MLYGIGLLSIGLLAVAAIIVIPSLALPVVYAYTGNYRRSLLWMRRYFRHDMAIYSPFDLVYLYILDDRLDEVEQVYRALEQKGNRGSEYFVRMWVAAHQGDWSMAEAALTEVEKYTITSDINLKEVSLALRRQDIAAIDNVYLIDMGGQAMIHPSLFRVTWVVVVSGVSIVSALAAVIWTVLQLRALL